MLQRQDEEQKLSVRKTIAVTHYIVFCANPSYYIRTFISPFPSPYVIQTRGHLRQAPLPLPDYGTRLRFYRDKTPAICSVVGSHRIAGYTCFAYPSNQTHTQKNTSLVRSLWPALNRQQRAEGKAHLRFAPLGLACPTYAPWTSETNTPPPP